MDFEMNRFSVQMADRLAQNSKVKKRTTFRRTLTIVSLISVLCLIGFHGTYFLAKTKVSEHKEESLNRDVRQISEKSGKAMVLLTNFKSDSSHDIQIDIYVKSFDNSTNTSDEFKLTQSLDSDKNIRQYTGVDIGVRQELQIRSGPKMIAMIPILEILSGSDRTVSIISQRISFDLKLIWQ